MPESIRRTEDAWKDAEAFIQEVERASRSDHPGQEFFDQLTVSLAAAARASSASVWVFETGCYSDLARCGVDLSPSDDKDLDRVCKQSTATPTAHWNVAGDEVPPLSTSERMIAVLRLHPDTVFGMTLRFEQPTDLATRQPLQEMTEVVLDLAGTVFARRRYRDLRDQLDHQRERDALVSSFYEGVGLAESLAAIAVAVARESNLDRVSLLCRQRSRMKLLASSTQPHVDRRARQVRLIEDLVSAVAQCSGELHFTVGNPSDVDPELADRLDRYLKESGCRQIFMETICDEIESSTVVIVMERFRLEEAQGQSMESPLDSIRVPVSDAVVKAISRDDAGWSWIAGRLSRGSVPRKAVGALLACVMIGMLLWWIPAPLKIPVEGRILAANTNRLFAPAEATVVDVRLDNGAMAQKGEPIVVLRSAKLELQQEQLQGELETAEAQLGSLGALRSRGGSASPRDTGSSGSAEEQIVKTRIAGLRQQLKLLRQQVEALTILSPIDGKIDRWNLRQSLLSRPVSHGQYLFDVVSTDDGWKIELELPDKHAQYVLAQQSKEPCRCTFKLTSGSDHFYEGEVENVAEVAHVNALGQSMIHVVVPYTSDDADEFRVGATVTAEIHCGQRSLGFVWFRGLFEWARRQTWF